MHMPFTFRAVLSTVLKDKGLSDGDRAHLYRWATLDYADDAIWKALAAAAHARGMLPPNTAYATIIREALLARRHAESVASGTDLDLRERQQYRKRQLQLAKYADDLADYYKWAEAYSGIAMYFMRFLGPVADLQEFHRKEALVLRQRAGREPRPAARVSRQDSSKAGRGLRKITAFIHMTNNFLTFWFSEQPDHEADRRSPGLRNPDRCGSPGDGPCHLQQSPPPCRQAPRDLLITSSEVSGDRSKALSPPPVIASRRPD
jgi:hypothetical protein